MKTFRVGDKARIVDMPDGGKPLLGQSGTVVKIGGFGIEVDDVMLRTEAGKMVYFKDHQLALDVV